LWKKAIVEAYPEFRDGFSTYAPALYPWVRNISLKITESLISSPFFFCFQTAVRHRLKKWFQKKRSYSLHRHHLTEKNEAVQIYNQINARNSN
jgi:hypothetical protein